MITIAETIALHEYFGGHTLTKIEFIRKVKKIKRVSVSMKDIVAIVEKEGLPFK